MSTFHSLRALRGVAALMVVVYHAALADRSPEWLAPMRWVGAAGVDLFFVLSGFLIARTTRPHLGQPTALPGYLFRRLWRVYPTYWVALGLAAVYYRLLGPERLATAFAGPDHTLFQFALLPIPADRVWLVTVAWTLSFELMFYLAVGLAVVLPRRLAGPLALGWAAAVVLGRGAVGDVAGLPLLNPLALEFLLGVLAAWALRPVGRWAFVAAGLWAVAGMWLTFDPNPHLLFADEWRRTLVFGPPAALLVWALAGRELGGWRPRGWLLPTAGDASYSIYLGHFFGFGVVNYLVSRFAPGLLPPVYLVAVVVAGVGAGVALHRLVERPLLNLGRRLLEAQPGKRAAAGAQLVHPPRHRRVFG